MTFLTIVRRLYLLVIKVGWRFFLTVFVVVFFGTWASMSYFEADAPIARRDVFWWYFIVTSTTVGYGDFSPATLGGRITGAVIMLTGIGLIAAIITRVAEIIFLHAKKRIKGLLQLHMKNHIVILGYQPGKTEQLVREILDDTPKERENIVLCSGSITENPMPGIIDFVHGVPSHDSTLRDASICEARSIIVYAKDDNRNVAYGIAANHHAKEGAHIAVYFRDKENAVHLARVNPDIECVTSVAVPMLVHAVLDPGTTTMIENLVTNGDKGTSYRLYVPQDFAGAEFFDLMIRFKKRHNVTLIGACDSHGHRAGIVLNPVAEYWVREGTSLFYVGDERLNGEIDWTELAS